jgi:hypothetical protein
MSVLKLNQKKPTGSGGEVTWSDVTSKPSTFPPSSHTHPQSDITNLTTDLAGKQATLVSGTNIKTINGETLLGSGDIVVTGDSGISAVAIVGANGITGASVNTLGVANVTLALGAITPTSVNSIVLSGSSTPTLAVTGTSSVTGTNTGDETTASIQTKRPLKTINSESLEGSGNIVIGASLSSAEAFCTAETTLSAATFADITGASISLTAGTWLILATANGSSQTTTATSMIVAITDASNNIIAQAAQDIAAGTATVRTWGNLSLSAIVSPTGTTTFKLRGARGQTTRTGNCIISDGTGQGTANNVSNNSDKSTSIRAIKIA